MSWSNHKNGQRLTETTMSSGGQLISERTISVGSTTGTASLADQVKKYKARSFDSTQDDSGKDPENPAQETLVAKCIKTITNNFSDRPDLFDGIPVKFIKSVTSKLPIDLDIVVTGPYVHDENYWKRCCMDRPGWKNPQILDHGLTWKQLYFERNLQQLLESFDPATDDIALLLRRVRASEDHVFSLCIRQLLSHIDLASVAQLLPNLTRLDVTYGVRRIGMRFERMLFGMKISDATALAKAVKISPSLTTLVLQSNLLDDDLLRMLMTGLIKNHSITHLDLSHNKITNHGARLLSKLLGSRSVLTQLDLCDNQIHAEGGRYLGRGLRHNSSLATLDLRLNRLTDEGGRMLFEGIRDNTVLTRLNVSSNSIGSEAAAALGALLSEPRSGLCALDLSCNQLGDADVMALRQALADNSQVTQCDLRLNQTNKACEEALAEIRAIVQRNELDVRDHLK